MCLTLWPHGPQYARLSCPSLSPGVCSDSHPLSRCCHSTISSSSPPSPVPSLSWHQSLFQWVGLHIRWPKYWSFSFSISPSNEYSGLISSFRIDWFDLFAVQGIFKDLPQDHTLKASILHSAFFMVQLSQWTGKTIVWLYRPLLAKRFVSAF